MSMALPPLRQSAAVLVAGRHQRLPPRYQSLHKSSSSSSWASSSEVSNSSSSKKRTLWHVYCDALTRRPLLTKASMAATIFFVSDSITQTLFIMSVPSHRNTTTTTAVPDYNITRAMSGAGFGVVATAWLHYWWGFLEQVVNRRVPLVQYRVTNTLLKVVIDQGAAAPCYIYSYYVLTNFLQSLPTTTTSWHNVHVSWRDTNAKAADMLWPTMLMHWTVWPAVHTVNFHYVPLPHRVLVQNTVLVFWSGYLSHLNNNSRGVDLGPTDRALTTPHQEIKAAIVRRETEQRMKQLAWSGQR